MATRPPVAALVIFDGWGVSKSGASNAIAAAKTPVMDRLYATQAHTELNASGEAVGLPPGVMGNSEVGHLTIGSGRVIYQDLMRITKAIESGAFARNATIVDAIKKTVGARHDAAYLGSALRRQRAQSYRSSDGAARRRRGERRDSDCGSCGARRTRQAAALGARFHRSARSEAEATRTRPNRDGHRALLCDGSRQAMGSSRARVARDGRRRRARGVERARGGREIVCRRQERRVRRAARDRHARADGGRRRGRLLQLPRRPRARDDGRNRARRLFRVPPPAHPEGRLRVHDRVRSIVRTAAGVRSRGCAQHAGRSAGACGIEKSARGRDREICARHLLPERRRRESVSARRARADSVVEGRDLRPRARDEGARRSRRASPRKSQAASST